MSTLIRPAQKNDALHVAALVDIAGHGIEAEFWRDNVDDDQSPIAAARRLIIEDETLPYHLSKAFILEVDGDVAGLMVGGLVPAAKKIDAEFPRYFAPLLELENLAVGFWAVIGVAVYHEFRGRGLATELLDHAEILARRSKAKGLSIVVEDTNTPAIKLYRNWGFKDRETRPWLPFNGRTGPANWVLLTRSF